MPRVMAKMMLATTANSTSIHFGMGHLCHKHNKIFTLDNIEECDVLQNCEKIREYANRLKVKHILEWESDKRLHAIASFATLIIQMKNLTQQQRVALVQTQPPTAYVKKGGRKGRKSAKEIIARTNTTIN